MDLVQDSFEQFLSKSNQLGDIVSKMANLTQKAYLAHIDIINLSAYFKKPAEEQFAKLTSKLSSVFQEIDKFKHEQKQNTLFNHVAAIAESVPAFGWIAVSPTPGPFVKEMADAAQFYTNKVLVSYKDKDKIHVEWVQSWLEFLKNLQQFIRQTHTTGLVWNARGMDLSPNATAPSQAPPPPPPPSAPLAPPPPPGALSQSGRTSADSGARLALLKELNQGTDITKNLRKITLDPNGPGGHSNAGGARAQSRSKTPESRFASTSPAGLPKCEFEGRKWQIEYQDGSRQRDFTIDITQMNQVVSVYRCNSITVTVKGKVNSITVDSCKNLTLAFDDIVSFVEFINCQRIQAYPCGQVATITVDKTDSIQLFLRQKSLGVNIISAKSSEINACIVDETSGDYKEHALPEQLKTVWSGNSFVTEAMPKA